MQQDNTKLGVNIVDQYMKEFVRASFEEKKLIARSTLQFIDTQLDTLKEELGGVERNLQNFRQKNEVFAPELQMQLFFNDLSETREKMTEDAVKIKVIDYLSHYMSDPKNSDKMVPSNLGIQEPTLITQITEFNQRQLQKEELLKTTQPENPLVKNVETSIEKLRQDILENLKNVRNAQKLSGGDLDVRRREADANVRSIPGKQKQLLEVTRRQEILQELYSFLLQKKLETAISSASTTSDIVILEPALAGYSPVSPNRNGLYTIALFLGIALPVGIIFLIEYLNDKVNSKSDISKATNTPILGEVGHAQEENALIVKQNDRSYIAEQFRIMRSNLQYVLPKNEKPVILVTSSFSGEGKSFVSTNLGAVMALSGKRTIILELDIRKPRIMKGLGMNERKGITNFLVSDIDVRDITHSVPDVENLFVIPCGPVPPNPSEMLLDPKLETLFNELKKNYDAIVIDSAPVGLVSDAISLSRFANACVYIVRHNFTSKKQLKLIDDLYVDKKLPNLSIVINDISSKGQPRLRLWLWIWVWLR
jgi:capsular exopolysaccharide synthesis family protein